MSEPTTNKAGLAGRREARTFARFVPAPENRAAFLAARQAASRRLAPQHNPLVFHGPPGTGKTHLVSALAAEMVHRTPAAQVALLAARDLAGWSRSTSEGEPESPLTAAQDADLFALEDLQHLPPAAAEALVGVFDFRQARQLPMIFTAAVGPGQLAQLGPRLGSRLASGLVVGLEPLAASTRRALLQDLAQRRQLAVSDDVLTWLAERLTGGGRQLAGAIAQLDTLARRQHQPLDLATVQHHFQSQAAADLPTIERIAERVGRWFQIDPQLLRSGERTLRVQRPRQVGMYLARQLTQLSLGQIGAWFGGRDHSTVLHACRRVERTVDHDAALAGAVRQLWAELV